MSFAHFFGETKEIINGKVVKDTAVNSEYDGTILHIDKRDKNKISHYDITDANLKKLLAIPMSKRTLLERLSTDYSKTTHKKHKKHKKTKKHRKHKTKPKPKPKRS
jgi:hypothetical protein